MDEVADGARPGVRLAATRTHVGGVLALALALDGDLDLSTGWVLQAALTGAAAELSEGDSLVVDLARVGFCAARGVTLLRAAARACAQRGVGFVLARCSDPVLTVLHLLDLHAELPVREDRPHARPVVP